jgi:hypothetical protein
MIVSICAGNNLQRLFTSEEAQAWVCIILVAHLLLNIASITCAHILSGDHELTAAISSVLLGK